MQNNKESGYILLMSVLFLGAISLGTSLFVITTGLVNSQNTFLEQERHQALSVTEACVERALQEIRDANSYSGTDTISFDRGECMFEVVSQEGQNRTIEAEGSVSDVIQRIEVAIDQVNPRINIVSWNEVDDF